MRSAALCLVVALFGSVIAEPPSGYSYSRPGGNGGGFGGGGFGGGISGGLSGGGPYQQVPFGGQTNEGQSIDQGLLEQIKQVLLKDESSSSSAGGGFGGGFSGGAPSSSYGAPSSSYGAPSSSYGAPGGGRVTGLDLEGIQQAIQVAEFSQQTQVTGGGGGYPSGPASSYGAPSRPSSSYGAPF